MMTSHTPTAATRGFTFIEVLVVMGIIAVLAGLTVGAISILNARKPEMETHSTIQKVAQVINQWYGRFDRYPPSDPTQLKKIAGGNAALPSMPNSLNVPIETLYQALYWPTFQGDPSLTDEELSNTDDDEFDKPGPQGIKIYEIKDAWGNPLIYFPHTEYAKAAENPPSYLLGMGTENAGMEVTPRPWKYEDEARGYAEANRFQLFSMGEDGEPNTEDDVKAWD